MALKPFRQFLSVGRAGGLRPKIVEEGGVWIKWVVRWGLRPKAVEEWVVWIQWAVSD